MGDEFWIGIWCGLGFSMIISNNIINFRALTPQVDLVIVRIRLTLVPHSEIFDQCSHLLSLELLQ